jgi:hypothetical protein
LLVLVLVEENNSISLFFLDVNESPCGRLRADMGVCCEASTNVCGGGGKGIKIDYIAFETTVRVDYT